MIERKEKDHWSEYFLPDDEGRFVITPLAIIDHARSEEGRELVKELEIDGGAAKDAAIYRVLSDFEYDEDDSTQSRCRMEYGLECAENGLSKAFLNVSENEVENPEPYAETIAMDIFPTLKDRTDEYYSRKT